MQAADSKWNGVRAVQNKEGVKGHPWFMDADMRAAHVLRLDKTGKALLTVLRHLGRLQEVRCPACSAAVGGHPRVFYGHDCTPVWCILCPTRAVFCCAGIMQCHLP